MEKIEKKQITIKIKKEILEKIEKDGEKNERNRTDEIIYIIKKYFESIEEK